MIFISLKICFVLADSIDLDKVLHLRHFIRVFTVCQTIHYKEVTSEQWFNADSMPEGIFRWFWNSVLSSLVINV